MDRIRVGIVDYLNTKPLLWGLERSEVTEMIDIRGGYPSKVASQLLSGQLDLGLVPVAALPSLLEYHIVGEHCIGTEGEIASVALFSQVPMEQITRIYLDYQSRTSVMLLQYLIRRHWNIDPELTRSEGEEYLNEIDGTVAGLVIGDRALKMRARAAYIYDLGTEWKKYTGLPFVFAVWASQKPLSASFVKLFDEANALGLKHIDAVVAEQSFTAYDLKQYYTQHLSYTLDSVKRNAMGYFLDQISLL